MKEIRSLSVRTSNPMLVFITSVLQNNFRERERGGISQKGIQGFPNWYDIQNGCEVFFLRATYLLQLEQFGINDDIDFNVLCKLGCARLFMKDRYDEWVLELLQNEFHFGKRVVSYNPKKLRNWGENS